MLGARNKQNSPAEQALPVLVLGSGVTALGVCRTLGRAGIPCYVATVPGDFCTRSRSVRRIGRAASDSADPSELEHLLESTALASAVLMPCSDYWLQAVCGLGEATRKRYPASLPSARCIGVLADKGRLHLNLERLAIPAPRTLLVETCDDLRAVSDTDMARFFLKPRDSQSFAKRYGKKAFPLVDRADAERRLRMMQVAGLEAVLQESVPGPVDSHYFVDGFVDRHGWIRAFFARRRLSMFPLDFGNSSLMRSVGRGEVEPAIASLKRLLNDLEYRGIFSAEFKRDARDGIFKLLEVNARAWWFVEFAALCGVDVCSMAYRDALGLPVETVGAYGVGTRHMMFSRHVRAFLQLRAEGRWTLSSWLSDSRGATDAVFRWDDPLPGVAMTVQSLKKLARSRKTGEGS